MAEIDDQVPRSPRGEPEGLVLPDEPDGEATAGGTATVVLGAAAGTLAGAFLGPVGAVVGAVAGGALASAMGGDALPDVGDVQSDEERDDVKEQHDKHRGQRLVDGIGKTMGNMMHEMGLDNGGMDKAIAKMTDGKHLQENVKDAMQTVAKNETASIAVGGTAGAVVGSILGPVGTVVGAVAGGVLGDRLSEQAQQSQQSQQTQNGQQAQNPKQAVQTAAQACAQAKEQLIAQMEQIPSPAGRTVLQMAINAVNQSVVDLETASGVL